MKMITKSMLCAGLLLTAGFSASAMDLLSPKEGEVYEVSNLSKIDLVWSADDFEFPEGIITVKNAQGDQVAVGSADLDFDAWDTMNVTFSPTITAAGTYTVVVPANMCPNYPNKEYNLTYKIAGGVVSDSAVPTLVDPTPGSEIVQGEAVEFNAIRLSFENAEALTLNEANISFTAQDGTPVSYWLSGWYDISNPMLADMPCPMVVFNFNDDTNMPSGVYTLTLNPGAITTINGTMLETKLEYVYDYTKTKADVDDTPLEITSALLGGAIAHGNNPDEYSYEWVGTDAKTITPDMPIAQFVGLNDVPKGEAGTGILVTINHGEKTEYLQYNFINNNNKEIIQTANAFKQADGSFLIIWPTTRDLYEGTVYTLELRAYDNIANKTEFGNGAELTFVGTTEAYKYSPAKFVTVVPTSGETLTSMQQNKVTVLFSEPVAVNATVLLGSGVSDKANCVPATEGETYDNVWYVYIPEYVMLTYPDAILNVFATDPNGLVVEGPGDSQDDSFNQFEYKMTMCLPTIRLRETNSNVAEIKKFHVYSSDGRGIFTSWTTYPYVLNAAGQQVATIDMEAYTNEWGDKEPFKVLAWDSDNEWDANPLELEFQVTPAITEKGTYTLVFPDFCFAIGTQFDSDITAEQKETYHVVDFFPVTYSTDNNTVALSPVEFGYTAKLDVQAKEGWKLETLLLNGEDVTAQVVDGRYESAPVASAMAFEAAYAYDGELFETTGVDDVVSDLNLRGWSEGGKLYVAGLQAGQVVNLYTVGGSLMGTYEVTSDDTLIMSVAPATYIVTVSDGAQTVALKLINK